MSANNQRRLLPSTSMLAAFDAAARAGSFTLAARELNLTQGAVSKQISALEEQLGVALFKRLHQSIALTETGKAYAKDIQSALEAIRSASLRAMTTPRGGVLNLAVLPTFATRWLIPRLPSFLKENPNITINFSTKLSPFDFQTEDLHAAIHYGASDWPNTESTYLMGEKVVPVCSPDYLRDNSLSNATDLLSVPLLHISSRPNAWPDWFKAQGLPEQNNEGMYFEQFTTAARAAVAGLGVVLLPKFLVENELERGELVLVINQPMKSDYGYFLVTPSINSDYAPVVLFREWLLQQAVCT
ncbi:MAG: LysR family transcriptional regulator [Gammaproteobacteria bacterium]|nr:LysR family transcriptional regulator [Gammaproteobacteria bacterium]MCP4289810.1 LysR family transcriptional regulator [Gammaproteobacteria bacterium]